VVSDRAGERVFGGVALGCGLLGLLHAAGAGAVLLGAALLGGPSGDVGLVLFATIPYAVVFPVAQVAYAGVAATTLAAAGRRPMALGIVIGSALTFVLSGACVATALLNFQYHP
jgi:hypothetical protein